MIFLHRKVKSKICKIFHLYKMPLVRNQQPITAVKMVIQRPTANPKALLLYKAKILKNKN